MSNVGLGLIQFERSVAPVLAALGLSGSNAGANFEQGLYWLPSTADPASPPRWATQAEWFGHYLAASATARGYVDAAGWVRNDLAANVPRFTWSGGRRWLGLNAAGTNMLPYSVFAAGQWNFSNGAFAASAAPAPDGSNNAVQCADNATSGAHAFFSGACAFISGTTYAVSIFLRAGTAQYANLAVLAAIGGFGAVFDLINGTVTANTATAATITTHGNGWYRCAIVFTATASSSQSAFVYLTGGSSTTQKPNYAGTGQYVHAWGWQVEANSFASPYIPTSGSAVTRAIETFELPAAAETVLQQTAASVVVRGVLTRPQNGVARRILGAASTAFLLGAAPSTESSVTTFDGSGHTLTAAIASGSLLNGFGVALGFDASGRALAGNGGAGVSDTNMPGTRTNLYLGRDANNTLFADGRYNTIAIFPSRLTNAQLQTLAVTP